MSNIDLGNKMQTSEEVDKARELFKILEMREKKSNCKNMIRLICIQELLRDLKRWMKRLIKNIFKVWISLIFRLGKITYRYLLQQF